tara:strand:- start:85 stop:249 length:165 start_codon:yes stop_codon:yes gene_type:complete
LNKKNKVPVYIKLILKDNSNIFSGRKNFAQSHDRILRTIKLIKEYFNFKNNKLK